MEKPWTQTYINCEAVEFIEPDPKTIHVEDIAWNLSQFNRYTGGTRWSYSVGQHSCIMGMIQETLTGNYDLAFEGLMHDATEAYLGDVSRPLKSLLPDYQKIEDQFDAVLRKKFGMHPKMPKEVKYADVRICMTEKRFYTGPEPKSWSFPKDMVPYEGAIRCLVEQKWKPKYTYKLFLDLYYRYNELRTK